MASNYICDDWLSHSMYECADKQYFEEYLLKSSYASKLKRYFSAQKHDGLEGVLADEATEEEAEKVSLSGIL